MTTIIVGDFDHEEILKKVKNEFDFKGRKNAPKIVHEIDKPVSKYIEEKSNVNTSYVMFGWLGPKAADLKDTICLDLISLIFGDGTSSRLYQNLIEKLPEPVFNMINSEHYQFKDGNNFFIQANFRSDKKEEAKDNSNSNSIQNKKEQLELFYGNIETVEELLDMEV